MKYKNYSLREFLSDDSIIALCAFFESIKLLKSEDYHLLKRHNTDDAHFRSIKVASERSINARLAHHLENQLFLNRCSLTQSYSVDVEYNLKYDAVDYSKTIDSNPVYPDLIVHSRGESKNLLIAEIKKKNKNNSLKSKGFNTDRWKLENFTGDDFRYELGIFIIYESKEVNAEFTFEYFYKGNKLVKPCPLLSEILDIEKLFLQIFPPNATQTQQTFIGSKVT